MKTVCSLIFLSLLCNTSVLAVTGMFGGYVVVNSGSSTIYGLQEYGSTDVPNYASTTLGSFTPGVDSLQITNASGLTFKGGAGDVFGVTLNYRVFKSGDTPGSFLTQSLGFGSNAPSTDIAGNFFSGSGDQEWKGGFAGIDLLSLAGAGAGTYNVELFLKATTNEGDRFVNNSGANYIATFAIPEPSKSLLLLLGVLGLILRRRKI